LHELHEAAAQHGIENRIPPIAFFSGAYLPRMNFVRQGVLPNTSSGAKFHHAPPACGNAVTLIDAN